MEFKSLKNIETSFRQIRTMGIVFVSLCALVTGYALWSSYRFAERQREKIYVLDNGKSAIESNIRRALFLCDESAFRYYKDWEEKGYYNRIISANINQSIRVDSVACDFNSYPYVVTTYARQSLVRSSNITERSLVTRCRLLNSVRSDNNPHGFTMEQFNIVENRDLRTVER